MTFSPQKQRLEKFDLFLQRENEAQSLTDNLKKEPERAGFQTEVP
jgi:hypothetical protein